MPASGSSTPKRWNSGTASVYCSTLAAWLGISSFMKSRAAAIAVLALDDHFLDVAVVDVADRALDQVAVVVDEAGAAEASVVSRISSHSRAR